jgi:cell division protein FtsL
MTKLALVIVLAVGRVAAAGAGSGSAAAPKPKCDPFNAMHGCDDKHPAPPTTNAPEVPKAPPPPAEPAKPTAAQLRQTCADAMNADPSFKEAIQNSIDKQIDQQVLDAHLDAEKHIQKNEKHVIIAYAALWALAALFVVFLWLRQLNLKREIDALKRDLEAAAKESSK